MISNNAILVRTNDGVAVHEYHTMAVAEALVKDIQARGGHTAVIGVDGLPDGSLTDDFVRSSAALRRWLGSAKKQVELETRVTQVLDRHDVPAAPELRIKIQRAIAELSNYSI